MNRTLESATALLLLTLVAAPARGQAALTVGSVRDQHGAVIVGADVAAVGAQGPGAAAATDAAGTFALHAAGITKVRITCRFCRPLVVRVTEGAPVVAIVQRYDALESDSPSVWDLQNLPYAHVESAVALHPFTLLSQMTAPYPGSALSDRGLGPNGSLLVDDGAPNYDIVAGESPYEFIPAQFEQNVTMHGASNAFAYGDQAGGGIVDLSPFSAGVSSEVATLGSDVITRAQVGSDSAGVALASFSNNEESRQRGDLFASWPLPADESFAVAAGSEQGRDYESTDSTLAGSFTFADATFTMPRALNLTLSAVTDRGNYFWTAGEYPISTAWSDSNFSAGIHTNGPVVGFADVAVRSSTGFEDEQALPFGWRVAASLAQTRADTGIAVNDNDLAVTAGIGAFWFDYAGGIFGVSEPARTALAIPSLDARLFPNGRWSLDVQGSGSFALPTFVDQYSGVGGEPLAVALQRNTLEAASLTYTDTARVRIAFETAMQNVNGVSSGKTSSEGISAIWQIAPAVALRAWTMHSTDTVPLYYSELPYGGASTVGAFWLTYDPGTALRADLIYRRDLLDLLPFYHVDGAISGPLGERLRWYAGAEDRQRRTFVDVGLRFSGR